MRAARLLAFTFALLASLAGEMPVAAAQTPEPRPDIAFYVAHGDADACGPRCSEWIAADGRIDAGAAQRLRRLLAKLGRRKLTIVFDSRGGSLGGSLELGRLIREQKLTVGVARTIPRGCDRSELRSTSCEALKRSAQELEADFDPDGAICASGCGLAVAGGSTRLLLPGVRLGIHDVGFHSAKTPLRGATLAEPERAAHASIQNYLRDMGIEKSLLAALVAVPNESLRFLARDEILRFGIDRREFGEDVWRASGRSEIELSKRFFFAINNGGQRRYRDARLAFRCGAGTTLGLWLALAHDPSDQSSADVLSMTITVKGELVSLGTAVSSPRFDDRGASVRAEMLDSIAGDATASPLGIELDGKGLGRIVLGTAGFAAGYTKLKQSCEGKAQIATSLPPPSPAAEPARYEIVSKAIAEHKIRLDSIEPNCRMGEMTVSILEEPQHGTLAIENGHVSPCNPSSAFVHYESNAGYAGPDSVTVSVAYPGGIVQTRHYSIAISTPANITPASEAIP